MVLFFNNKEIFTVLLSKLSWSVLGGGGGEGGARSQYFIPEAELFEPWRGFVQRIYTQTVSLEMSCEISGLCFLSNAIELPMFIITTLFTLRLFCGKSFI